MFSPTAQGNQAHMSAGIRPLRASSSLVQASSPPPLQGHMVHAATVPSCRAPATAPSLRLYHRTESTITVSSRAIIQRQDIINQHHKQFILLGLGVIALGEVGTFHSMWPSLWFNTAEGLSAPCCTSWRSLAQLFLTISHRR